MRMFGLTPETVIRDSLYDLIPLSHEAARLIATPEFLRLDGIQQLGFVSRVWPGARHTRFEHSLGVMCLMQQALERLNERGAGIDDESARVAIAAALLHDIGHYPFSHAIEELGAPIASHEQVGSQIVVESEIAGILRADWRVDPARVARLISPGGKDLPAEDRMVRGLLSGALDVDKLDYLPRDARACHVPYGGVDTTRLLGALRVIEVEGRRTIGIDAKGISPLHSLINARQEMFDNVYWHHTNRACMAMLLRAVQEAVLAGLPPEQLTRHDDASLLAALAAPELPATTRRLVGALAGRRLHKRAVEISSRAGELFVYLGTLFDHPGRRRALENVMVSQLRHITGRPIEQGDILVDIPKPERWRTDVWVRFDNPPVGFAPLMPWHDVAGASPEQLKAYEDHRRLIRIVCAEQHRADVRQHWQRLLLPLLSATPTGRADR
ncbi:MAG TPA: HD domain-containing protein [Thermomicrobiales bacterium]|nr:HD domain-containing protein [Thermomicrobiales bacterium]HRA30717.1 HD domain-containing protein [Thermomicrobiales bacterium]